MLATYRSAEDLINIGAYAHGSNPKIDFALSKIDMANNFLKQEVEEPSDLASTANLLTEMFRDYEEVSVQTPNAA